jgi:hypothetical protein
MRMVTVIEYLSCKRKIDHLVDLAKQVVDGDDTVIQITAKERFLR